MMTSDSKSTMKQHLTTGSCREFDKNWQHREEAVYNHWVKGRARNQIQLAFQSHWEVFNALYPRAFSTPARVLEVGCGRGSMSSHFCERGWRCSLLDYSQSVLDIAKTIFRTNGHQAEFISGDARALPFADNSFDITVSIGLLEHFENVDDIINEQYRVLKPGGVFLGYVVPERPDTIQRYFNGVNRMLRGLYRLTGRRENLVEKEAVYRSDHYSPRYLDAVNKLNVTDIKVVGMYSLPMISHSPAFPFSLMSPVAERCLTAVFKAVLWVRKLCYRQHGWICDEKTGQAFLVAFVKQ
ncbi:MAG: class I SAM-dependent methyltransferase [Cellvibrionaceae bacterium]|nr:class I SAM-dependent methyltransferase [Cellvibrionaceae bacterium]